MTIAAAEADVVFVGRLATYRDYDMDQVAGPALAACRKRPNLRPAADDPEAASLAARLV